jgi:hypothetical protein
VPTSRYAAGKLAAADAMTPLERWLDERIAEHAILARERSVRGDRAYLERMGSWDTRNVDELSGGLVSRKAAEPIGPELVSGYRADPRDPERVDGIEEPHSSGSKTPTTPVAWNGSRRRSASFGRGARPPQGRAPRPKSSHPSRSTAN